MHFWLVACQLSPKPSEGGRHHPRALSNVSIFCCVSLTERQARFHPVHPEASFPEATPPPMQTPSEQGRWPPGDDFCWDCYRESYSIHHARQQAGTHPLQPGPAGVFPPRTLSVPFRPQVPVPFRPQVWSAHPLSSTLQANYSSPQIPIAHTPAQANVLQPVRHRITPVTQLRPRRRPKRLQSQHLESCSEPTVSVAAAHCADQSHAELAEHQRAQPLGQGMASRLFNFAKSQGLPQIGERSNREINWLVVCGVPLGRDR